MVVKIRLPSIVWCLFTCIWIPSIKGQICVRPVQPSLGSTMSQDSHHGKWTISSSDDDDDNERLPLSGTTTLKHHQLATSANSSPRPSSSPKLEVKAEPAEPHAVGLEARQTTLNQSNPGKYENSPLSGKRKKEAADGSGWALSDSDDEDNIAEKRKGLSNIPKKEPPSSKAKKIKAESERPPSPHGRVYYIDEPEDFFESSVPCLNDMYRFYLNKVTGLDRKYNNGALHIRGECFRSNPKNSRLFRMLLNLQVFPSINSCSFLFI